MASSPPESSFLPDGWTWSDVGHGALDLAGLVPIIGEGADLANAAWLAAEGDYLGAGLSIISMVPIVGDAIGKGGKLLKSGAGKLAGPALDALKAMDFKKMLASLAKHPKIGPVVKKIEAALDNWRADLLAKSTGTPSGVVQCPKASKALGAPAAMISKTPVPTRILEKLTPGQRYSFEKAVREIEEAPLKARPGKGVFYSGYVGTEPAWKISEKLAQSGRFDSVNSISNNILNRGEYTNVLPDDAMGYINDLASRKLAANAQGAINFIGDVERISPSSVFRRVELPELLSNPNIDAQSRANLLNMKYFLDSKYGK